MLQTHGATGMQLHNLLQKLLIGSITAVLLSISACGGNRDSTTSTSTSTSTSTLTASGKKLLETGWDTPRPAFVKANIDAMQARPFDGLILRNSGPGEVFTKTPTADADFAQDRADLAAISWGRFTDNFMIMQSGTPTGWDWFSDADWAASEANARQFARLVKAGNLKGVLFDAEPYLGNPWSYAQQIGSNSRSFAAFQTQIRERGKRFMQVMQEEAPGLKVMMYYGLTAVGGNLDGNPDDATLQERLKEDNYGLWASFYNGMLDAAQAQSEFIEGNEGSYYYLFATEYDQAVTYIRDELVLLVDKPLRSKYAAQNRVSQAIYADGVMNLFNTPRFCGYYFENDADRLKQLEHNVYHSLRSADQYAWFYSESMDWWGTKGEGVKIPAGMQQAVESARAKIAASEPLGLDLQAISTAAKERCDSRRNLGGTITYPDTDTSLSFDVKIDGKAVQNVFCASYSNNKNYGCVFAAGVSATVTPVKPGYRFEPSSRSYGPTADNLWNENYTAIKQ
jgi:hypothetical protein